MSGSRGRNPFSLDNRKAKAMQVPSETKPALWGAAGGHSRGGNPHADLRGQIPAERGCDGKPGGAEEDLFELGAGQFRGEGRVGHTPRSDVARLRLGQGMCREAGPGQNRSPVIWNSRP